MYSLAKLVRFCSNLLSGHVPSNVRRELWTMIMVRNDYHGISSLVKRLSMPTCLSAWSSRRELTIMIVALFQWKHTLDIQCVDRRHILPQATRRRAEPLCHTSSNHSLCRESGRKNISTDCIQSPFCYVDFGLATLPLRKLLFWCMCRQWFPGLLLGMS